MDQEELIDVAPFEPQENKDLRIQALQRVDFRDKDVLDIGGYYGYAARYALQKEARKAIVVDVGEWRNYGGPWNHQQNPNGVIYISCDMHQWDDQADITICGNVLYHDRNPWAFLSKLKALTREACVLWTRTEIESEEPIWKVFDRYKDEAYRRSESFRYGYCTEYWECSPNGLLMLMDRVGWRRVETVGVVPYPGRQTTMAVVAYP